MTPKQRAEAFMAAWPDRFQWTDEEWVREIERAIDAAVAGEREACAQIAERFRDQVISKPSEGLEFYKTSASVIRDRIRARSESRNWSYEIQTDATFP